MIYNRLKNLRFFRTLLTLFNNISLHRKIVLTYFFFIFMLVGILAASIYTFTASTIRTQSTCISMKILKKRIFLFRKLLNISPSVNPIYASCLKGHLTIPSIST